MPTPEQMQIIQRLKQRKAQGENIDFSKAQSQEQNQSASTTEPQVDVNALITQALGRKKNIGNRLGDAISILGGGQPIEAEDDFSKDLAKVATSEAIKKQFGKTPYDDLIEKSKAVEAARNIGNKTLFNELTGNIDNSLETQQDKNKEIDTSQYLSEIDPFTKKPTSRAIQAQTAMRLKFAEDSARARGKAKFEQEKTNISTQAKVIEQDLDDVLNTWKEVPKHLTGAIQGRTFGPVARFFQVGGGEKVQEYDDTVEFIMANISRQLGGERGVLTDRDIARIKSAMPMVRDNEKNALNKINRIKRFIKRRVTQGQSGQLNNLQPDTEGELESSTDNVDSQINSLLDQLGAD